MTRYHENGRFVKELPELMAKGMSDMEIMAEWNVGEKTLYRWLNEHEEFKEAYEIGLPKRNAFYLREARAAYKRGDDKGYKYFKALVKYAANWKLDEVGQGTTTNNQINIGNVNVLDNKSREDLLEYVNKTIKSIPTIDVKLIENSKSEDDTQSK